jgi:hypothetical protein
LYIVFIENDSLQKEGKGMSQDISDFVCGTRTIKVYATEGFLAAMVSVMKQKATAWMGLLLAFSYICMYRASWKVFPQVGVVSSVMLH